MVDDLLTGKLIVFERDESTYESRFLDLGRVRKTIVKCADGVNDFRFRPANYSQFIDGERVGVEVARKSFYAGGIRDYIPPAEPRLEAGCAVVVDDNACGLDPRTD